MRILLILLALSLNAIGLMAQDTQAGDTTIYRALEAPPRFPACEQLDTTLIVIQKCAEQSLLEFMYSNIRYPQEAREQNLEGNVVATFVVEKDGQCPHPQYERSGACRAPANSGTVDECK